MCIRDSPTPGPHPRQRRAGGRGAGLDPHLLGQRQPGRLPCLLYTSDAADERSSVDLGGRRIIKKKKTIHYTTRKR